MNGNENNLDLKLMIYRIGQKIQNIKEDLKELEKKINMKQFNNKEEIENE